MIPHRSKTVVYPSHKGDSTHSHDHVTWPVNLRPINRTVSSPIKPIPGEDEDEDDDILFPFVMSVGMCGRLRCCSMI